MSTDHNPNVSFASDPITHRHNRRGRHGRVAAVPPRSILESILEPLEARLLMSTYWVTSAADSGAGSLRAAILAADAAGGSNVIDFAIGSGLQDISLQTALPAVTDSLTIDGTTQSGYAGTPLISLNGQGLTTAANGLTVTGNNTLIRGLDIVGFTADGILLQGSGETVQNSFVGVEADGVTATANGANGIEVSGPAGGAPASAVIENNVISGNDGNGVSFSSNYTSSEVADNHVGVDVSGSLAAGNGGDGVYVGPAAAPSGGVTVSGNVISGNLGDGVTLDGAAGAVVTGNTIGTDAAGADTVDPNGNSLSNSGNGVTIEGAASGNTIGGPSAGDGNLISGNFGNGVEVVAGTGSLIQGNDIGTSLAGTAAVGNYGNGVSIEASGTDLLGNVVSGNYGYGVWVAANSSVIQGNLIGVGADRPTAVPNQADGVYIAGSDNLVGGAGAGEGNIIAFNMGNGVTVDSGTQNTISRNSIYSNSSPYAGYPGIGIDLGDNGVTLNDSTGHTGPNLYQDFPDLTVRSGVAPT